jgi:hypothetical protein
VLKRRLRQSAAGNRARLTVPALAAVLVLLTGCTFYTGAEPEYFYFAYGVGDYNQDGDTLDSRDKVSNTDPGRQFDLPFAYNDGLDIRALLENQGMEKLSTVDGPTVTSAQVLADLDNARLSGQIGKNDIVLFYYAGHGANFGGIDGSILALSDMSYGSPYISNNQLWQALESLGAFHLIVIIDACNSGGFIPDTIGVDGLPDSYEIPVDSSGDTGGGIIESFGNYFNNTDLPSSTLIVAAGKNEESFEWGPTLPSILGISDIAENNGVFTGFLLESALYGDANRDGKVTVSEAYHYVFRNIDSYWNNYIKANSVISDLVFYPHISGGGIDPVLFRLD